MSDIHVLEPKDFPPSLCEIPQPPKKLYMQGSLPDPEEYMYLAVVGSRRYSRYGKEVCEKLIEGLAGYPIVIVSGLAIGMDLLAHKSALKAGLPTVAIPGSGLHESVLYPRQNAHLAKEIIENGGAMISELEPDQRAALWTFPKRNRIMAGLSRAVLVIEASQKSGTLITARMALDYNRDVFAVPADIFSPSAQGSNWLLKQGAQPVTESRDILSAFGLLTDNDESSPQKALIMDITPDEQKIIDALHEPLTRDDLIRRTNLPAHQINVLISTLEIKGCVSERLGKICKEI